LVKGDKLKTLGQQPWRKMEGVYGSSGGTDTPGDNLKSSSSSEQNNCRSKCTRNTVKWTMAICGIPSIDH